MQLKHYIFILLADLSILVEQLSKPELRRGGCVLQSLLAECVQRCNSGKEKLKEIHTSFICTIPKLVSLPNFKNTYVPPPVKFKQGENSVRILYKQQLRQYWNDIAEAFFPKTINSKVKPPRVAWLIVNKPGYGKSRLV